MLTNIIIANVLVGLIGAVGAYGVVSFVMSGRSKLMYLVSFAAGALVAVSFFDLLPEAIEAQGNLMTTMGYFVAGFIFFLLIEKSLLYYHCHDTDCQSHASSKLIIFGDGKQTRDFTFVENIVDLNILAAKTKSFNNQVYNGGTGGRYSLNTVWNTLCKIEGLNIRLIYKPSRPSDIMDSQADISLARKDFGYKPKVSLEEGLKKTLIWYKSYFRNKIL